MRMRVPLSLDARIAALAGGVDEKLRSQLQAALRVLRQSGYEATVTILGIMSEQLLGHLLALGGHQPAAPSLSGWIDEASRARLLPTDIASALHSIRILRNRTLHGGGEALTAADAEVALERFLSVMEWFYCASELGPHLPTLYRTELADTGISIPAGIQLRCTLGNQESRIHRLAWSPDGAILGTAAVDGTVCLWRLGTGWLLHRMRSRRGAVYSLAFAPDGALVAAAGAEAVVDLWRVADGTLVGQLQGHTNAVWGVAFSPDGLHLATASDDCSVRLWRTVERTCSAVLGPPRGHQHEVWGVAFSPDGALLASASADTTVRLWHAEWDHGQQTPMVHFGAHGALSSSNVLLPADARPQVRVLRGHSKAVFNVAFSPDGLLLASASVDSTVQLWDIRAASRLATLRGHADSVEAVAFSPDGRLLGTKSLDGTVRLWRADNGMAVAQLPEPMPERWHPGLAFHPTLPVLASLTEDQKAVRLWELDMGVLVPPRAGPDDYAPFSTASPHQVSFASPASAVLSTPPAKDHTFSSHTVLIHYPAPVALPYRRFCDYENPTDRLLRLFAAVEAVARYLLTLGISDLFHCLAESGDADARLPDHPAFEFLKRPRAMQLGLWLVALQETARGLATQPRRFLAELPAVADPGGRLLAILGELVSRRNRCIHEDGSISIGPEECRDLIPVMRPLLDEVLESIRFVCHYPLGFARCGLGRATDPGQHRYYFHSCMGTRITDTRELSAADTPVRIAEDLPFVVAPDGARLLYLWPLLLERVARVTGRRTLYVFEEIPDDDWPFLTKIRSSAIDVRESWRQQLAEAPSASHAWLLQRLRQLPAAPALPAALALSDALLPTRRGQLVGQFLRPDLQLVAALAAGGFGTIYAAHGGDGRRLAVKVLEVRDVKQQLKRFLQEFDKLQQAGEHPGIIRCYERDIALIGGREYPWYSMELALGDLTGRLLERGQVPGALPWDRPELRPPIIHEFRAITAAVAYLHQLDIVHRDIKPGNVLVMDDGSLRLSDFGLVKNLRPRDRSFSRLPDSSTGGVKGTRDYMAPEQERGRRVDKPADVYALGVLLAELAVGQRPAPRPAVKRGSTLERCPLVKRLPAPLRDFIRGCTDVAPNKRPHDARAVRERFTTLAADLGVPEGHPRSGAAMGPDS
jgi:WD40 repeat protein